MTTWRRDVSLVLVVLLLGSIYVVAERWQRAPGTRDDAIAAHPPVCDMLTPAEIGTVLGRPVGAGTRIDTTPERADSPVPGKRYDDCFWSVDVAGAGPDDSRFVGVELDFTDLASYDAYGAAVNHPNGNETVRAIRVGSNEGLLRSINEQRFVLAISGRHVLQVQASTSPSGPWRVEAAIELTRRALSRIGA